MTSYMHPHEIEEIEQRFSPRMWDATPGVCCAYFQTGACAHTEAFTEADMEAVEADPHPRRTTGDDEVTVAVEDVDEPF